MSVIARAFRLHTYLHQPILQQMQLAIILIGALFWVEARLQGCLLYTSDAADEAYDV